MIDEPVWRYMSLAKYVDLLRTKSLYFPKASRFQDKTEGKWWAHAYLYANAERWSQSPANRKALEGILERAGQDQSAILQEIQKLIPSVNEWVRKILLTATRAYPHKRREYLEGVIASWKRNYDDHGKSVEQWKASVNVHRQSTYISCWNRASSMSLAMWEMYGGGPESVALRTSRSKLVSFLHNHTQFLEQHALKGGVADVKYLEGLKNPDEQVQEQIYQILFEQDQDLDLGLFTIKPSIFDFEREVRAVIYPKRDLLDPIDDPYPDKSGFHLSIENSEQQGEQSIAQFIEAVYVHPLLDEDSMMVHTVKEINNRFELGEIPVVAEKIEAMGANIMLPPIVDRDN
jgi:hypothetical protein